MKTLFLKSNILHLRTNEGEFKVSNPESIGFFESGNFFLKSDEWGTGFLTDPIEWPGGVEIKNYCASDVCDTDGVCEHCREPKKLARLIPEESESDYEEFEGKDSDSGDGLFTTGSNNRETKVESSEPQEEPFEIFSIHRYSDGRVEGYRNGEPIKAFDTLGRFTKVCPESQEDFAISFAKFCQVDLKGRTFNDLMSEFKATRKPE